MITAIAPALWALLALSTKAQSPLLITAILPFISVPFINAVQPSSLGDTPSSAKTKSPVIAVFKLPPKSVARIKEYSPCKDPELFIVPLAFVSKTDSPLTPPKTLDQVVPPSVVFQTPFPLTSPAV